MNYGIIVDLETTGLDASKCGITEIGVIKFIMPDGDEPAITDMYASLNDPGQPIPDEITKLTGIKPLHVQNKKINWETVASMLRGATVVIAHNSDFDRSFLNRVDELKDLPINWGCSRRHIDWKAKGFKTQALNYLAADHGFVNPFAHRALFDCATTFRLIQPYLKELIDNSKKKSYRVEATKAAYEKKDILKANSYKWDTESKVWYKIVFESQLTAETAFLKGEVYPTGQVDYVTREIGNDKIT